VLGFIDDCITQDLQESQSKLINARWICFATAVDESSVTVFRDGLISVDLCECVTSRKIKIHQNKSHAKNIFLKILFIVELKILLKP